MHYVLAFDSHFPTSPSQNVGGVYYLRASTYIYQMRCIARSVFDLQIIGKKLTV